MKKTNVIRPLFALSVGLILVLMTVQIVWSQFSPNCVQPPVTLWVNRVARPPLQGSPYVELNVEDYVTGALEGEMGPIPSIPQWNDEALRAGSVAIRTWGAYWCHKHPFENTPYGNIQGLYDTSNAPYYDQEYDPGHSGNTIRYSQEVTDTQGIYLTYNDVLIDAQHRARNGDPTNPLENPFTPTSYPYLRSVVDPVAAAEIRSQPDEQSVGLAQKGSHYWASGQDPTTADRFYPQWGSYAQILTHYYTDVHLKDASGSRLTPNYRWVPLSVNWQTADNHVPIMDSNQSYAVTFWIQNTGLTTWPSGRTQLSFHGWEPGDLQAQRTHNLSQSVAPGDTITETLTLYPPASAQPGTPYGLRFEMFLWDDYDEWQGFSVLEVGRPWPTYDVTACVNGPCKVFIPLALKN